MKDQRDSQNVPGTARGGIGYLSRFGRRQNSVFWDELPLMLYDIRGNENEQVAEEVLDELRSIRQTYDQSVCMVFTRSIGLRNVLTKLKRSGYASALTNDMKTAIYKTLLNEKTGL